MMPGTSGFEVCAQIKARDVIAPKAPAGYVVALNLQANTPRWLQALRPERPASVPLRPAGRAWVPCPAV